MFRFSGSCKHFGAKRLGFLGYETLCSSSPSEMNVHRWMSTSSMDLFVRFRQGRRQENCRHLQPTSVLNFGKIRTTNTVKLKQKILINI